jgi:glycosyltransferase involved in cell wall biosynthesis
MNNILKEIKNYNPNKGKVLINTHSNLNYQAGDVIYISNLINILTKQNIKVLLTSKYDIGKNFMRNIDNQKLLEVKKINFNELVNFIDKRERKLGLIIIRNHIILDRLKNQQWLEKTILYGLDIHLEGIKKIENYKRIWVQSEDIKKQYIENGIKEEKLEVIEPLVYKYDFNLPERNDNEIHLIYAGTLRDEENILEILEEFKKIHEERPDVKLKIVYGKIMGNKDFQNKIKKHIEEGIKGCEFKYNLSHRDTCYEIATSDIGICWRKKGWGENGEISTKVKEYKMYELEIYNKIISIKKSLYIDYKRKRKNELVMIKNIENGLFSPRPENFEYEKMIIPKWEEDNKFSNTWHLHNHSLEWLIPFINEKKYKFVEKIIIDWISNNPDNSKNKFSWYDHVVSMRIKVLVNFLLSCKSTDYYNEIFQSICKHCDFLCDLNNHPNNNHSLYMFISIIVANISLNIPNGNYLLKIAKMGIYKFIYTYYSTNNIHLEQSPQYHLFVTRNIMRLLLFLKNNHKIKIFDQNFINMMKQKNLNYKMFVRPDNNLPLIGDTQMLNDNVDDELNNIDYLYKTIYNEKLKNDNNTLFCKDSGYFIYKSEKMHLTFKCNSFYSAHYHNDGLSFTLFNYGIDWLVDSGMLNYNEKDKDRIYIRSAKAHNLVIFNDEEHETPNNNFESKYDCNLNNYYVTTKMTSKKFIHERKINIENECITLNDNLKANNQGFFTQLFHVHPEISIKKIDNGVILNHNIISLVIKQRSICTIDIIDGIYSTNYNKKISIKTIKFNSPKVNIYNFDTHFYFIPKYANHNDFLKFNNKIEDIFFRTDEILGDINIPKNINNYNQGKRKILYLVHTSLPIHTSGYTIRTHNIIKNLRKKNIDIRVMTRLNYPWLMDKCFNVDNLKKYEGIKNIKEVDDWVSFNYYDVEYIFVKNNEYKNDLQYFKKYASKVLEYIINNNITILHSASSFVNGIQGTIIKKFIPVKTIFEIRGLWEYTKVYEENISKESKTFLKLKFYETYASKNSDLCLTLSNGLKGELINRGIDEKKIKLFENGINSDINTKKNNLVSKFNLNNKFIIGYIGSLATYEGIDVLIKSVHKINIDKIHLLIVGDGKEYDNLNILVNQLKIQNKVTFTGKVNKDIAIQFYNSIDLSVFPRYKTDVTDIVAPLKPMEAMVYKIPIILSDVNITFEYVKDKINGLIFESGNVDDLTKKILKIYNNKEFYNELAQNEYNWVTKNRNWDILTNKLIEYYDEITLDK